MAELMSRKDEELVVRATQAVLDKYGADSDLSDLLHRVRESDATAIFNGFCKQLIDHLRPLVAISRTKALSSFHQLSITALKDLWRQLFTELEVATVQALTMQSVNRHLFNLLLLETSILSYETTPVVMSSEEENAVRYASGYVAMKLMKALMKKEQHSLWSACHTWQWKGKKQTFMPTQGSGSKQLTEGDCFTSTTLRSSFSEQLRWQRKLSFLNTYEIHPIIEKTVFNRR